MELLICQPVYYLVPDSNDFGTISGRKERINARSGTVAANAIRNGRQKKTRRVKKQRLVQGSPTLSAQTAERDGPPKGVFVDRESATRHPKASLRIAWRPPADQEPLHFNEEFLSGDPDYLPHRLLIHRTRELVVQEISDEGRAITQKYLVRCSPYIEGRRCRFCWCRSRRR
jgi:hypothetical protein